MNLSDAGIFWEILLIAIAVLPCALQILGWEISLLGDERGEGGAVVAEEALEATLEECTEMYWKNSLRCTEYKFHQISSSFYNLDMC